MAQSRRNGYAPPDYIDLTQNTKRNLYKIAAELHVETPKYANKGQLISLIQEKTSKKRSPVRKTTKQISNPKANDLIWNQSLSSSPAISALNSPLVTRSNGINISNNPKLSQISIENMENASPPLSRQISPIPTRFRTRPKHQKNQKFIRYIVIAFILFLIFLFI